MRTSRNKGQGMHYRLQLPLLGGLGVTENPHPSTYQKVPNRDASRFVIYYEANLHDVGKHANRFELTHWGNAVQRAGLVVGAIQSRVWKLWHKNHTNKCLPNMTTGGEDTQDSKECLGVREKCDH